ncbi:ROK family transcriptional regulator [Streptomyces sp. NBC_01306]|uniref:ROK family transcriptional regulator n=1 Tax=Streptomyces sp. NBC_01306 TaxID=2903819 RepID=UPI00224FD41E|nr:ROK family transcriptional regulator [Streptomyces sp. NBC_01306]MCX4729076.1 ROK family transcriptional regulator [Streptomyces sp. NBC_01306]
MAESAVPPAGPRRPQRSLLQVPALERRPPERTKASTLDSRVHNRSLVLATLYHEGPRSRSEIARATGLTAPTVSALVADLEEDGLVAHIGPRQDGARIGKPASLVRIEDDAVSLVVLDLSHNDRFSGAVLNLRGEAVERLDMPLGDALGPAAHELVLTLAAELVEAAPRRILGIGVGSPGIIDDTGTIRLAAHLGWTDLPLAAELTARFGIPAYVGNDVNLAALGVLHFRGARTQNLMVISIEHGVGAGLIVGGERVEGEQFAAGELGHVTVDEDGELCMCGRRGCLDLAISAGPLGRRLELAAEERWPALRSEAGRALGTVLAPIISVLNLNEIVLTGPPELVDGEFLDAAREIVRARTLGPVNTSLDIRSLAGDTDLTLLGGACLVLAAELGVF